MKAVLLVLATSLLGCRTLIYTALDSSQGSKLRDEIRYEAAVTFDCNKIELDSIADGYVAKGCGQFQHFTCTGDTGVGWEACTAEPPIKIPTTATSRNP